MNNICTDLFLNKETLVGSRNHDIDLSLGGSLPSPLYVPWSWERLGDLLKILAVAQRGAQCRNLRNRDRKWLTQDSMIDARIKSSLHTRVQWFYPKIRVIWVFYVIFRRYFCLGNRNLKEDCFATETAKLRFNSNLIFWWRCKRITCNQIKEWTGQYTMSMSKQKEDGFCII